MDRLLETLLKDHQQEFEKISDQIWEYAEVRYQEYQSASLLKIFLEAHGFQVEEEIGGIPTAFCGKAGSGSPVIAFLGEYDALPGLSQMADADQELPAAAGGAGHGCGHNLLGAGALEAACALKAYMEKKKLPGTILYYGCPAEENGAGKAFMLRAGCFQGVDFALTWHPFSQSGVWNQSLANAKLLYRFTGKSSHASAAPQNGRSALDACELMNVGVNYLREHVPLDTRMHYAYTNAGGAAPNIVPAHAELFYVLRAATSEALEELLQRVTDVARGAALMTGTKMEMEIVSAYREILNVPEMEQLMLSCMEEQFPISYTDAELDYAKKFHAIGTNPQNPESISSTISYGPAKMGGGSTDVGDVSWNLPTGVVYINTMASGTVIHSWSAVAQGKSSIAHKGMHTAADVLADAGRRLLEEAETRQRIQKSFQELTSEKKYVSLIPPDTQPGR